MNKVLIIFLVICINTSYGATGNYYSDNDPFYADAMKQAEKVVSSYVASCGKSNYVSLGGSSFIEFKEAAPKVELIGNYPISESDKLNGKLWHGKFIVFLGKSYRRTSVEDNNNSWLPWDEAQSVEFNLVLFNKEWKIDGDVSAYEGAWFNFKNGVSCDMIPLNLK